MKEEIVFNIEKIQERINIACKRSSRSPGEVQLLLTTKTVSPERIKYPLESGYTIIAENKIQELKGKFEALSDIPHTNHFIGHLQSNKIKELLKYNVSCIQSLDRLDLAEKLNQRLLLESKTIDVLIQVNTSEEESKFGVRPYLALDLVRQGHS